MDVALIVSIALTAITLIVWLFSFLMGTFKDGTAKAFWKFTWAGLSALATFGLAIALRGVIVDAAQTALQNAGNDGTAMPAVLGNLAGALSSFTGAMITPFLFCTLYLPVRWILLIPQSLLWKHLVSPNLDKLIKDESGELKLTGFWRFLWKIGGGVFRVAATILLTSAIFLGLTCYTVTAADAARPFVALYDDKIDGGTQVAVDGVYAFTDHFSVRTAAFTYGGLFRSMTSVELGEAKTNLPEILETTSLAGYQICRVAFSSEDGAINNEQLFATAELTLRELSESDFFPAFLAFAMNQAAEIDEVKEALLENENKTLKEMGPLLLDLMEKADTESMRADLLSMVDLLREASDSGILAYVLDDSQPFPMEKLMNEERLTRLLMVIYDNSFGRALFTPVINMALNVGLESLGAEPINIQANIEHMSREEMQIEAERLAKVISKLAAVLESTKGEGGASIRDLDVGALGEAFDLIKESELLGDQYEAVLDAVGKSDAVSGALGDTGETIIGALKDAPSVEDALVISQSFTVIAEELSKGQSGEDGTEVDREGLANALQSLVSSANQENNDFILDKVDELFPAGEESELPEEAKDVVTSILEAAADVDELTEEQAALEAESLLGLYDMVSGNTEAVDGEQAAEDIIENIADSTVLMKTVENAVEEGTDFGITEALPEETIDQIEDVINDGDLTEEQKATLLAFFGRG